MKSLEKNHAREGVIWNAICGLVHAGQSPIILIFISRFCPVSDAGIFSIGYAIGTLVATAGKYGIRNFQVTDITERFTFWEYFIVRLITVFFSVMVLVCFLFFEWNTGGYNIYKMQVVFWIAIWRMLFSFEDVLYGFYQQNGRLDIATKYSAGREFFSILLYGILLYTGEPLLKATLITVASNGICMLTFIYITLNYKIKDKYCILKNKIFALLKECFPLCLGTTLAIYVSNVPKYMIDQYLNEKIQAIFGYIMLPAFIVLMLSNFIYQPIVRNFGELWNSMNLPKFKKQVWLQYLIIMGITIFTILIGVAFGLPVLSFLYHVDLVPYDTEFIILLIGTGMYAISSFLIIPLTTIRFQNSIAIGFVVTALFSLLLGKYFVKYYGMIGAAILYLILNFILVAFLTGCFWWKLKTQIKHSLE